MANLHRAVGVFLQVVEGVDYDAPDCQPVYLVFALLVPREATEEHLQILASLAEKLIKADLRERLRQASSYAEVQRIFSSEAYPEQQPHPAAV